MTTKHDCPLCMKSYQSEKKLNKHCEKIHNKSLEELRAMGMKLMTVGDFSGGERLGFP